jgi:hypothetical protein
MRKTFRMLLVSVCLVLGGCQMDNEENRLASFKMTTENLPNDPAFQDEFTRSFLQSTHEVKDGYYPFLSATGAYKMWLPKGAEISDRMYGKEDNRFESIFIGVDNGDGSESQIAVNYYLTEKIEDVEFNLEIIEENIGSQLDFTKTSLIEKDLYTAFYAYDSGAFGYAAYIQNTKANGGIHIIYKTKCQSGSTCIDLEKKEGKRIMEFIESIEFVEKTAAK